MDLLTQELKLVVSLTRQIKFGGPGNLPSLPIPKTTTAAIIIYLTRSLCTLTTSVMTMMAKQHTLMYAHEKIFFNLKVVA